MGTGSIGRATWFMEQLASALLGGAVAFAAWAGLADTLAAPQLSACAAALGLLVCLVCSRGLKAFATRARPYAVKAFDVRDLEPFESDELLLTDADRVNDELVLTDADRLDGGGPLELDDILAEIEPDSRVVRLFGRKPMPTPGQLKSRIDNHLEQAAPSHAQSDDSQALSDALAELRRSLR
jgi:hypothetical protein